MWQWDSILPYLLTWVMIYSFGINTDFENKSQFDPLHCLDLDNYPKLSKQENVDLRIRLLLVSSLSMNLPAFTHMKH